MKLEIQSQMEKQEKNKHMETKQQSTKNPISNNETKQGYQKITRGKLK